MKSAEEKAALAEAEMHVGHILIDGFGELNAVTKDTAVSLESLRELVRARVPASVAGRYFHARHPGNPPERGKQERQQRIQQGAEGLVEHFIQDLAEHGLRTTNGKFWVDLDDPPKIKRPGKKIRVAYRPGEDALADRKGMQLAAAKSIVEDLSRILGDLDEGVVATLETSMRRRGYIEQFPVIKDTDGHTIAGRHREAAAARIPDLEPAWRTFTGDDIDAAYIILADTLQRRHLTAQQVRDIHKAFKDAGYDLDQIAADRDWDIPRPTREDIRAALLGNPELSHNKIAKTLGVHNFVVDRVCKDEVTQCVTSCTHGLTGQGARTDRKTPGTETQARREQVLTLLIEKLPVTKENSATAIAKEIGAALHCNQQTVLNDWDALATADRVTARTKRGSTPQSAAAPVVPQAQHEGTQSEPACNHACPACCPSL